MGNHEIIIVDNGSTDNTSEIVAKEYKDSVILIRNKTDKSLNHCKSMAIKRSGHEIVAFIDDDCVPCENWPEIIKRYLSDPECDMVAGPVRPLNKIKYPKWWQTSLNWAIGLAEINDPDFAPLGCNVAFKKNVLDRAKEKTISENHNIVYSEDTLRIQNAVKKGYKLKLNNDMIAYHDIIPEKLSLKYLIRRSWLEGNHWSLSERSAKILIVRGLASLINPFRFIITLNLNYMLRWIVSISYILAFFRKKCA